MGRLGFETFDLVSVTQLSKDRKLETLERGQVLGVRLISVIYSETYNNLDCYGSEQEL